MKINATTMTVVRGSVLEQDVDAVVNAANEAMRGGGGIDGLIHRQAGPGLLDELKRVAPQGAKTGTAVITAGHGLRQPFIIHTPGPVWGDGHRGEPELLASCYRSCLELAAKQGLSSIGFCSISTGIYGYPIAHAAPLALATVATYLRAHLETPLRRVIFSMYADREFEAFSAALADLQALQNKEPTP